MSRSVPPAARLGLVTDRRRLTAAAGRPLHDAPVLLDAQVAAAAAQGLAFVQLREPDLSGAPLLALTRRLLSVAAGRTRIVVNDRADVAAVTGAGLHLRQASMPAAVLRPWMPAHTWITRAVHTPEQARAAGPVDALLAGTAAATVSKPAGSPTLGPGGLAAIVTASPVPVFAIGGLTPAAWPWLRASGAFGLAAIGCFLPRAGEDAAAAVHRAVAEARAMID